MKTQIKTHLFLNPIAGNGLAKEAFEKLTKLLNEKEIAFDCEESKYPGDLVSMAKNFADQENMADSTLIVIGGDGSLNEVVNGIKHSHHPNFPITYLPAGSGNDFARAAHISKNPAQIVKHLLEHTPAEKVDCGCFSYQSSPKIDHYFVNNLGIGFDAFVVYQSNHQKLKKGLNKLHLGNMIYGLNILSVLQKQDTFSVDVQANDNHYHFDNVYFATTTNHPYFGGGIAILPKANIYSHKLDCVIVQKPNMRKFIHLFQKLLKDGSHVNDPHFHYIEADKLSLETHQNEYAQIDGEDREPQKFRLNYHISSFYLIK